MTFKLYEMFIGKYPEKWNSFSIYGADERINILLRDKSFFKKNDLINKKKIKEISKKYFEDFYEIKKGKNFGLEGLIVLLNPNDSIKYERYSSHSFWIPRYSSSLDIELSTGNRGEFLLTQGQRMKYFWFVNSLFNEMKENALKI